MPRIPVNPENLAQPPVPLSAGIRADNVLYVSGILPFDKDWKTVGKGDIRAQTRQVIENIKEVVEKAGGGLDDVVFNAIFLRNVDDYHAMNEVYAEYFCENPPARYCIEVGLVPPDCLIEICSTAHLA